VWRGRVITSPRGRAGGSVNVQSPAVGDWVRSYSPGAWQVYRVLGDFNEFRYSPDAPRVRSERVLVFSKRLVNDKWKRAFRAEVCERSLATPLPQKDRRRVASFLAADPGSGAAFDAYVPPPIPLTLNLTMAPPKLAPLRSFGATKLAKEIVEGVTLDRVLTLLGGAGLSQYVGKTPASATLQLTCRDHEVRDHEFVFRDWSVLPF
jgi:hypothetical protein